MMMDVTGCQFVVTGEPWSMFELFEMVWVGGASPKWVQVPPSEMGRIGVLAKPFLAVPVPQTSLEHLAASVLMKEPCGARLVDCLIETQSVDVDAEVQRQIREKALEQAADLVRVRMLNTGGSVRVALQSVVDAIEGLM